MALENDTQAPDFELLDQHGQTVRLSDYRGRKAVALVFFPLAFSGTCTGELCALRDNLALFDDHAVELIGGRHQRRGDAHRIADRRICADFSCGGPLTKPTRLCPKSYRWSAASPIPME